MDRFRLINQKVLAVGSTVYGQQIRVTEDTYSPALPGAGETAFSVSVTGTREQAPFTAGFVSIDDAKRFLHGTGEDRFVGYTHNGQQYEETRECLGVPKGMVSEFGEPPTIAVATAPSDDRVLSVSNVGENQVSVPLHDASEDAVIVDDNESEDTANVDATKVNTTPPSSGNANTDNEQASNAGKTAKTSGNGSRNNRR